jgi:hypothetical protein
MPRIILLGPQRFKPTVAAALDALDCPGPVAAITAGWQEREEEVDELAAHVDREVINLRLYRRAEKALAEDEVLARALRQRQEALQRLQELYRLRLSHALEAARDLMRRSGGKFLSEHRQSAVRAVRALDRQHLARLKRYHAEFDQVWQSASRAAVARHLAPIRQDLERARALAIAGGHVAVLLNRLRLFDILSLTDELPIVAWSAGAMVLSERVVLFHDNPPQGPGDPELFEAGFAVCPGVLPLPDAERRLRLEDPVRVALLARRFAPAVCVALDAEDRLEWDGRQWIAGTGTQRLTRRGVLAELDRF